MHYDKNTAIATAAANSNPSKHFHKRHLLCPLFCLPISLVAILLILLFAYDVIAVSYMYGPFAGNNYSEPAIFSRENVRESARKRITAPVKLPSDAAFAIKEENPPVSSRTQSTLLHDSRNLSLPLKHFSKFPSKRRADERFSLRVNEFLSNFSCELRFFMTWISLSLESFGQRELFTIESLFNSHPNACLIIVSDSIDTVKGTRILNPFVDNHFKLMAVSPDYDYLFNNTAAAALFDGLRNGDIDPGKVPLGQNLSNLLRLSLLYKYGGIYLDTDFLVLKSLSSFRNVIGAQKLDPRTGKWRRLNNAVMIFDKNHPLLAEFIQEFGRSFNGNKWGHNGPYLVSRVVQRVNGKAGYNFTVLPPPAFYPVGWAGISSFFEGPRDEAQSKWLSSRLEGIRDKSLAVHLWNRRSKSMTVEEGSIINHLMLDCCVFCNSSAPAL